MLTVPIASQTIFVHSFDSVFTLALDEAIYRSLGWFPNMIDFIHGLFILTPGDK